MQVVLKASGGTEMVLVKTISLNTPPGTGGHEDARLTAKGQQGWQDAR